MKVLGISGGQKDGNNDSMCKEALMVAQEMGADVEFIRLHDLELKYCIGCVACSISLVHGKGNRCVLKDDFDWLLDKMLDADGIIMVTPIFEKGASGIFHTIMDRFGPRTDRGNNILATEIAEKTGGTKPDPRFLKDKVISYIAIGGSDWSTRVACDHAIHAMSPMWKIIDNDVFSWSKAIIMEDDKIARIREIGKNLTEAAKDIENAEYKGAPGVCPHCHSNNFFHERGSRKAICCMCGIEGEMREENGEIVFKFPEEQLKHAHDTPSGKAIHSEDIRNNEVTNQAHRKSEEYQVRVKRYKDFISASKPAK